MPTSTAPTVHLPAMPRFPRILCLVSILLLALLVSPAPADEGADDDAKARAYERDQLIQTANRAVGGSGSGRDPLEAMQRSLADDHAYMMGYEPKDEEEAALLVEFEKTVAERILLVGWLGDGEGTAAKDGALQEARRLDAWLAGRATCDVLVRDEGRDESDVREYGWPPEPEQPKEEPPPPGEEGAVEAPPPGPPPAEGETEPEAPTEGEKEPAPPAAPPPPPTPPAHELDLDDWAVAVVAEHEGGTLQRKVLGTAVCGVVDQLLLAARQRPAYVHPEVPRLVRHAVVSEDVFAYNAPYAAFRLLQADEREHAMQEDHPPPSLVDESMVRQKAKLLEHFQKDLAHRKEQRAGVLRSLDRMVVDLDGWKTQAALLAQEIEERQRALVPPESDGEEGKEGKVPVSPAPLGLRLAEARESLVSLDITLLYQTAVRAEQRLKLLDRLVRAAEAEVQSAEQAHTRYESALRKLRGSRRLDRLLSDEHRLRLWISQLEEKKPAEGTVYETRLEAYRAVLSVLEVVQEAVVRQRELAPGGADEAPVEAADTPVSTNEAGAGKTKAEKPVNPLPAILRKPENATWDVTYVELAARELEKPEMADAFDARLVARHYSAVDDRIQALVLARERSHQETELTERYERARAVAEAALEPLDDNDFAIRTRRLPALLATAAEDFSAAMDGIAEQGERNRERIEALLAYRARLRDQGTRSLLIRTDRDLADDDIRAALGDTTWAAHRAGRWLTFQDEEHAGRFLGASWLRVLGLLALVGAAVLGVKLLRRRVDVWIETQAAANPALRAAGASVREEKADAKRRREEQAVTEVTDEDILQTVIEEEKEEEKDEEERKKDEEAPGPVDPPPGAAGAVGGAR